MGKLQRSRFFNTRQASLRSRQEEDYRQIVDNLDIEIHRLRQQLDVLNTRLNDLSLSNNRYRARYRTLRTEYNSLLFRFNYSRSEVDRLQGLETVERAQALARDADRLRRNFNTLLGQLQDRSEEFNFPFNVHFH